MTKDLSPDEYDAILRSDHAYFAERCFCELNPQTELWTNWHIEVIAAKLAAVREGKIRRLIINLPPRHLKSLMASVAFPAWCLGHDQSAQILCVSYAQDLADKLARDCRSIMMSPWYRRIFPTRLAPHRQAVQEFITNREGYRLATSTGGVLTGRGAENIETLLDEALNELVVVTDHGGRRKVSKRKAFITQIVNGGAKGNFRAVPILLAMLKDFESDTALQATEPAYTEADRQIIQHIQARLWNKKE